MNDNTLLVCVWCGHIKYDLRYGEKVVCCAPDGDGHLYKIKSVEEVNKARKFNNPARKWL